MFKALNIGKEGSKRFKGAVISRPLKIVGCTTIEKRDALALLDQVGGQMKSLKNSMMFWWQVWHHERKHGEEVAKWMDDLRGWHKLDKKTRPAAPKCPVEPATSECMAYVTEKVTALHHGIHGRVINQAVHSFGSLLGAKATKSAFKKWHQILTYQGEMSVFSQPQPIPLKLDSVSLCPPKTNKEPWLFKCRVDKFQGLTKAGTPKSDSTELILELKTFGYKSHQLRQMLEACYSGEYRMLGPSLVYKKKQWYVAFCYQLPKDELVTGTKTAVVTFGRRRPYLIRVDGRTQWLLGRGSHIEYARRQLSIVKETRNSSYRYGSKSRRGHGRHRATYEVKNRMGDLQKTANQQAIARVCSLCKSGIGKVVVYMPAATDTRFLKAWNYYQFETSIKQQLKKIGVECVIRDVPVRTANPTGKKVLQPVMC